MNTQKSIKLAVFLLFALMFVIPVGRVSATGPVTGSEVIPVDTIVYNPCSDEWVWLTGNMHFLYHDNLTPSGQLKWRTHTNYSGVAGYGLTSGKSYIGVGVEQGGGSTVVLPSDTPYHYVVTAENTMSLIAKGGSENYVVHMLFHITVTPDFEWKSYVDQFSFECR